MILNIDLDEHVVAALDAGAAERGVSREELVGALLGSAAEGLRRSGAWEREHVDALLAPLDVDHPRSP